MENNLLGEISEFILLPKDRVDHIIRSAPHRYKVYQIPKRSGKGTRTIAQPAREVKRLQVWVMSNIFPGFPIHESAKAYVKGKNIKNNAEPHAINPFMLKLDFKNFFPSIKGMDFLNYLETLNKINLSEPDRKRLVRILFWAPKGINDLRLSIGAPSSPYVSNAIMYQFDEKITNFCSLKEISYTRYADDMSFSMAYKELRGITLSKVREVLAELSFPKLTLNEQKTVFGSKAHRRIITGLILSNEGLVSLGRNRKRQISAKIHHFLNGKLPDSDRARLRGTLAFAKDVEPDFINKLKKKYGSSFLKDI